MVGQETQLLCSSHGAEADAAGTVLAAFSLQMCGLARPHARSAGRP